MQKAPVIKRTVVTVDDRRAVVVLAKARKPEERLKLHDEVFIGRALKERMGWDTKTPASEDIRIVARQMAAAIPPIPPKVEAPKVETPAETVAA